MSLALCVVQRVCFYSAVVLVLLLVAGGGTLNYTAPDPDPLQPDTFLLTPVAP